MEKAHTPSGMCVETHKGVVLIVFGVSYVCSAVAGQAAVFYRGNTDLCPHCVK